MTDQKLRALALVCTLKPGPSPSSTELLAGQVLEAMPDVDSDVVRVVDHDVRPGVQADMGDGDAWPAIREKVLAADILVLATPTWLGQPSSVCQRVLERLDAELSDKDEHGRPRTFGKVAVGVIVGNEDGAHHITGIIYQALSDVGFTIPAQGVSYWNGEAMHSTDYRDLDSVPKATASTTKVAAANAIHLATLLKSSGYPATD